MYKIMMALRQVLCNKKIYYHVKCRVKFARDHCCFHSCMRVLVPFVFVRASSCWATPKSTPWVILATRGGFTIFQIRAPVGLGPFSS